MKSLFACLFLLSLALNVSAVDKMFVQSSLETSIIRGNEELVVISNPGSWTVPFNGAKVIWT